MMIETTQEMNHAVEKGTSSIRPKVNQYNWCAKYCKGLFCFNLTVFHLTWPIRQDTRDRKLRPKYSKFCYHKE